MGFTTLLKIQWTQLWHQLGTLKRESKLKMMVILLFGASLWGGLFYLFWESFMYIKGFYEFEVPLIESIFAIFFLSLFIMLTFSNGIIVFSSLFRSEETRDLLTRPIAPEVIFLNCFSSAILFSSWAFLFLAAPLMVAFGVSHSLPLIFYPIILVFFLVFLLLPAALGSLIALLITYFFPRSKKNIFIVITCCLVAFGTYKYKDFQQAHEGATTFSQQWMEKIFKKISFAKHPAYPSFWVSEGVLSASSKDYKRSLFLLAFLLSNSLFFTMLAYGTARAIFRPAYNLVSSSGKKKKQSFPWWVPIFKRLIFFLKPPLRHMMIKDIKTFFRDPVQWSQLFIFLGLLFLYILNIRRLEYHLAPNSWKIMISYLNMFALGLTLSTFTSRFIYPQISLEGKRLWILGVFPMTRRSLLTGKFLFSLGGTLILSELMMGLSCYMIESSWQITLFNMALMAMICVGLAGMSVGLGAIYPNFAEENPSKIVSGFGGTLNLLLSLFYVVSMVVIQGFPVYLYYGIHSLSQERFFFWMAISTGSSVALSLLVAFLPLQWGKKIFDTIEL